jgi:hypothetical protein
VLLYAARIREVAIEQLLYCTQIALGRRRTFLWTQRFAIPMQSVARDVHTTATLAEFLNIFGT